jgi:predicted DNA-binding protein
VPRDSKFKNPLLQRSTETPTEPPTETSTAMSTLPSTVPSTFTFTSTQTTHRKRGAQSFEKTHERITLWIDKGLKQRFEALAEEQGRAKSTLLDEAIAAYLEGDPRIARLQTEVQHLQQRLNIEEKFRTDTEERHFKKWLRSHDQPQGTDFFRRFLADGRLPHQASRSMYKAKLRVAGYTDEETALFEEAWRDMLFTQEGQP